MNKYDEADKLRLVIENEYDTPMFLSITSPVEFKFTEVKTHREFTLTYRSGIKVFGNKEMRTPNIVYHEIIFSYSENNNLFQMRVNKSSLDQIIIEEFINKFYKHYFQ